MSVLVLISVKTSNGHRVVFRFSRDDRPHVRKLGIRTLSDA